MERYRLDHIPRSGTELFCLGQNAPLAIGSVLSSQELTAGKGYATADTRNGMESGATWLAILESVNKLFWSDGGSQAPSMVVGCK